MKPISVALLLVLFLADSSCRAAPDETPQGAAPPTDFGRPAGLPRPSEMSVSDFEGQLFEFLNSRRYQQLGWLVDKGVRDTGPYLHERAYGTHPTVRVYYSPEVVQWLVDGREGAIPDGACIVKEQYEEPAAQYAGLDEELLWKALKSWTVMVKDSRGSHDGWFWSNPAKGQELVDYYQFPFEVPYSGFGLYCVRCHASTQSPGATNEYTFASLRNIVGFPGEPLLFRVDDSWRKSFETPADLTNEAKLLAILAEKEQARAEHPEQALRDSHPRCTDADFPELCVPELNEHFVLTFPQMKSGLRSQILHLPPVTHDSVPRATGVDTGGKGARQAFVTSDQCMSCHAGLTGPFGPSMVVPPGPEAPEEAAAVHISPYGEWRWTPMGLAGRDPIFYAQLESELAILEQELGAGQGRAVGAQLQQTCLGCHGAMGKRQHDLDFAGQPHQLFAVADVYAKQLDPQAPDYEKSQHAALARDGVSCAVCHRMAPRPQPADDDREYLEYFLETSITGNFHLGEPNEIYGPYQDDALAPYAMNHATGFQPKHSNYIKSSQMCGTCHTVNLPIIDWAKTQDEDYNDLMLSESNPAFKDFHHHVEQATYLEWLNSEFENEINPENPNGKSCQDCHMSRGLQVPEADIALDQVRTRVAIIQDQTYPDAENLASHAELNVRYRDSYSRHNFRGLNVFMLEMFNQFDDVLGVRKFDYMTGSKTDIEHAVYDFVRQASQDTARIDVTARMAPGQHIEAVVDVQSLVGHRFPSGVGFRRAFLELLVVDESRPEAPVVVWASGRTNDAGVIVDGLGKPLETEFFAADAAGKQRYQPHHEVITSSDQVQIYETLLFDRSNRFTTSFIHGCTTVKDNRFLPRGWTRDGPGGGLGGHFLTATHPGPRASQDLRYQDGSGSDATLYRIPLPAGARADQLRVKATLYYQAIPPYFLKNIFDTVPEGEASQRLHYICSNLKLEGTVMEGWKLQVVSAEARVRRE